MRPQSLLAAGIVVFVVASQTRTIQVAGAQEPTATPGPWTATASSEWGPGYGAAAAADAVRDENGNYWQTVEGKDKDAWWQVNLGQAFRVQGVEIAWARYQDKYHCPPAGVIVEISLTGKEGSFQRAREIETKELPRDQQPYDADRKWYYPLPQPSQARYLRLVFPDGGQPGAKYKGYLCMGEVQVQAPGLTPQIVTIEGPFGKAEVNVTFPAMTRLYLRTPGGLTDQSLLAMAGRRPWARGGCTYVVGNDGRRFASRLARPEGVELSQQDGRKVLRIVGVKLSAGDDLPPVAVEDWTLSAPDDGSVLVWKIVRRWQRDFTSVTSGSPGLFFSFDALRRKNSVTSTIWYDPLRIAARPSELYALHRQPRRISENHVQTIRDRDSWSIYKLWTNWHAPVDFRLEVEGGHLYRRGSYAFLSEAGAVTTTGATTRYSAGQVEGIAIKIGAVDKYATGYQLAVTLPDKETEASLKDFYQSVFNGGAVNDQKGFDFGNETDGWYYAGSSWMYGMALAAGAPARGQLSTHPYDAAEAFREHLAHILSRLDDQGRAHFGYNQGGQWVDDNLHTIIGTRAYLMHTGDLHFVRQNLPALERMLAYFVQRRSDQGLFRLADAGAHWYYDAIRTSGVNGYYNAFFYKAACDLAAMEAAAGYQQKAEGYRQLSNSIKAAFNEVLWKEDAPGGPRYLDWIDGEGNEFAYFCDLCQWPPIAVGIASREQARKIVATADARIVQLEQEFDYQGYAGLSALWPVPKNVNPIGWQTYGTYMNGGSLLCQTYWEIVARTRAGDAAGAYRRLRLFARRASQTSWAGNNAFTITAEPKGDGEPYLADMVVVTAATVHGTLGIKHTWDRLDVTPCLPEDWPGAEVEILHKGRRHRVKIEGEQVQIEPLEQVVNLPLLWTMDWNLQSSASGVAEASNIDFGDLSFVALNSTETGATKRGTYQSPPCDWMVPTKLNELTVASDLNGGQVTATVETSDDGFKTTHSQIQIPVKDGVNKYPLDGLQGARRAVRVRLDLVRGQRAHISPVVDGFRIIGQPAAMCSNSD